MTQDATYRRTRLTGQGSQLREHLCLSHICTEDITRDGNGDDEDGSH